MRRHGILMGTAVVAAAFCLAWSSRSREEAPALAPALAPAIAPVGASTRPPLSSPPPAARATRATPWVTQVGSSGALPAPPGSGEPPDFAIDAHGDLVIDGHTRDQLERLLALNDPGAALGLLQQTATTLPVGAYREATDAYYAYQHYAMALRLAFPPEPPVADEATAVRRLTVLQALRVEQFGADTARAYFGDEEAAARQWLVDMQAGRPADGAAEERGGQAQRRVPEPAR